MLSEAEKYSDITLDYFSGDADDNKLNGILEDCVTKEYDLVIVQETITQLLLRTSSR